MYDFSRSYGMLRVIIIEWQDEIKIIICDQILEIDQVVTRSSLDFKNREA